MPRIGPRLRTIVAIRRREISLEKAKKSGVSEIKTPDGDEPLPEGIDELETLKEAFLEKYPNRNLYPAGSGYLAVLRSNPLEIGLFWSGDDSRIPVTRED